MSEARAARERGELRAAADAYDRALEGLAPAPRRDDVTIELLEVVVELGELERARGIVERFEATRSLDDASDPRAGSRAAKFHYLVARVMLGLGRAEEAEREARRSIAVHPTNALSHQLLGQILAARGDDEAALRELTEALRGLRVIGARLEEASVHYQFGRSLARLGREEEAAMHFAEHEKLQDLRTRLGRLERRVAYDAESREAWLEFGLLQLRAGLGAAGFRALDRASTLSTRPDEVAVALERVREARAAADEPELRARLDELARLFATQERARGGE